MTPQKGGDSAQTREKDPGAMRHPVRKKKEGVY